MERRGVGDEAVHACLDDIANCADRALGGEEAPYRVAQLFLIGGEVEFHRRGPYPGAAAGSVEPAFSTAYL